jgi:hypothetical protein
LIREIFIYFKRLEGRLVFDIKLEGVFVTFKETSGEVSVFFPKINRMNPPFFFYIYPLFP